MVEVVFCGANGVYIGPENIRSTEDEPLLVPTESDSSSGASDSLLDTEDVIQASKNEEPNLHITVFSVSNCYYCDRLKAALSSRFLPYTDISLSSYPAKRVDMLELSDQLTVPQVFIDGEHIGGADDAIALLEKWEKELYPDPMDRLRDTTSSVRMQVDERLSLPDTPPVRPCPPPPRNQTCIELPNGSRQTVLEVTSTLMSTIPRADLPYRARIYKDCFTGRDGVVALMTHYKLSEREDAIQFGRRLQRVQILDHVCGDHTFGDSEYFFRLQPYHQPNILNSFMVWTERVDPNAMGLLDRLRKLMAGILSNCTDSESGLVDYVAAHGDPNYLIFEESACELQGVSLYSMDEPTRLAFAINVYNLMIKHAFIKVGVASTGLQRGTFYGSVCYNIGGEILSFNHIEHGIIRKNTHPPYQLSSPFSRDDKRSGLALSRIDPRIHFALNCGARSCPPVKNFTAHAIEEELRIVSQAFCDDDYNVSMDETNNEISLSMIFNWYRADFAKTSAKLPQAVLMFLRGGRKEKLQRMIDCEKKIDIKFKSYDWKVSATRRKQFKGSNIDPNEVTLRAYFSGNGICSTATSSKLETEIPAEELKEGF